METPLRRALPVLALAAVLLAPRAHADTPLEDNRRITVGYIALAYEMGMLLDPTLEPGGKSQVRPNWFVFAPHASRTGGQGMLGAALARKILTAARGEPSLSVVQSLARAGVQGTLHATLEQLSLELVLRGLPIDGATSVASLTSACNGRAFADPRTLLATASRLAALYWSAPGTSPLDKADTVVLTLERLLNEGNLAIFSDVGGAGRAFLDWRRSTPGALSAERVLEEFSLPGAVRAESRRAYAYVRAHMNDTPRPSRFDLALPGLHWRSLLVTAFALYEDSRHAATPAARDALIALGNNCVAWREQYDQAQPVFSPATPAPDEVSRPALLEALTPSLKTDFGTQEWTYADYAYTQPDRDGSSLTSPPTEYNWAVFLDRWSGILYAFDRAYTDPAALWVMPDPLVNPLP